MRRDGVGFQQGLGRALEHHFAALSASPGADVDEVVGGEHHVAVVFHDDDRVSEVAQLLERVDESLVVALVQADGGFVEDVEHIDELRADLRGEANALALAAAERGRLAVERQIVESHAEQELHARAQFLNNLGRNLPLHRFEVLAKLVEPVAQFVDVERGHFRDVFVPNSVRERLALQPLTLAFGTFAGGQKLVGPLLSGARLVVFHHLPQVFDDAVELHEIVARGVDELLVDADVFERAVENFVHRLLRNVAHGRFQREFIFLEDGLDLPENHLVLVFSERHDGSLMDALAAVGDDFFQVDFVDVAQSLALRTGSLGRVERENVRRGLAIAHARDGVHQPFREVADGSRFLVENHQGTVALLHGRLHAVAQAVEVLFLHFQLVDDHLDVVIFVAIDLHSAFDFLNFAIDADVEIALAPHRLEKLAIVALALSHERGEDVNRLFTIVVENHLLHLLLGVFHHFLARAVAVGRAGAGVEQSEIVVDFGGGAHGGARIFVRRFLLDADDGRQPRDFIYVGSLHVAQKIAGVGRKRLDVATLSLGENRVEGQRRLARAAQSGDDRERLAGNLHVDVLEVMDARSPNVDFLVFSFHGVDLFRRV